MKARIFSILTLLFSFHLALASSDTPVKHKTVYDYSLVDLDGKETPLSTYKGKALLIVNLASQSIYKTQLKALEELQKTYAEKGLIVIGIPCGDFGAQELTDATALQHYYRDTEHLTFLLFSKSSMRGKDAIPLVRFLTDPKAGIAGGEIHWNFTKFIIDRTGLPVARMEADNDPADPEFRVAIEQVLNGTFKKKDADDKDADKPPSGDEDDDGI